MQEGDTIPEVKERVRSTQTTSKVNSRRVLEVEEDIVDILAGGGGETETIDYTAISTKTFDNTNREIITFNHISTGEETFTINLKGRSKLSLNEDF